MYSMGTSDPWAQRMYHNSSNESFKQDINWQKYSRYWIWGGVNTFPSFSSFKQVWNSFFLCMYGMTKLNDQPQLMYTACTVMGFSHLKTSGTQESALGQS